MLPMTFVETPILRAVRSNHRSPAGVHLVARDYPKGMRIDPHLHREAQLIYAARGTMQVTTPGGRWLVPPDRAVWVPAGLQHAIDLLADIEMRTLYFDLAWLKREQRHEGLTREFVVRVSLLLNQAILALFDARNTEERTDLLVRLVMLELVQAEDSATFVPLPHEPRCRRAAMIVLDDPTGLHDIDALARAPARRCRAGRWDRRARSWPRAGSAARVAAARRSRNPRPGPVPASPAEPADRSAPRYCAHRTARGSPGSAAATPAPRIPWSVPHGAARASARRGRNRACASRCRRADRWRAGARPAPRPRGPAAPTSALPASSPAWCLWRHRSAGPRGAYGDRSACPWGSRARPDARPRASDGCSGLPGGLASRRKSLAASRHAPDI